MVEDILRALGFLPLGTRMKRIGERLQADAQAIMDEMGVPLQASHYPFLAAIDRLGPLTLGQLAEAVGVTQPGATRSVAQLIERGMLKARPARDDQRQRIVSLAAKGQHEVDRARREVWPRIEAAVADLCGALEGPLLDQLAGIEDGLAVQPLNRRGVPAKGRTR
jgi:DNA-binding MarR family transcriptional regulator